MVRHLRRDSNECNVFANIFVAWATIVHFQFFAHGVSPGEAIVLYLGGFLTIVVAGPGRFSLDSILPVFGSWLTKLEANRTRQKVGRMILSPELQRVGERPLS
jgi:hypothetical protein